MRRCACCVPASVTPGNIPATRTGPCRNQAAASRGLAAWLCSSRACTVPAHVFSAPRAPAQRRLTGHPRAPCKQPGCFTNAQAPAYMHASVLRFTDLKGRARQRVSQSHAPLPQGLGPGAMGPRCPHGPGRPGAISQRADGFKPLLYLGSGSSYFYVLLTVRLIPDKTGGGTHLTLKTKPRGSLTDVKCHWRVGDHISRGHFRSESVRS